MGISICVGSIRAKTLGYTIEAIQKQTYADWELIVVVQGENPEPLSVVERYAREDSRIRSVQIPKKGVSVSRNAGIAAAKYDVIAMTDDDCEPRSDWLTTIQGYFDAEPNLGLLMGSLVAPKSDSLGLSVCPHYVPPEALFDPETMKKCPPGVGMVGANIALRRRAWERIGAFDERLGAGAFLEGGEDIEYLIRAEARRIRIRFTPRSEVLHTYGRRYGWKAVTGLGRSYARGQGAVAAKLTLQGMDGASWYESVRRECLEAPIRSLRLHRLVKGIPRWRHFQDAYAQCLQTYVVNQAGLLCLPEEAEQETIQTWREAA